MNKVVSIQANGKVHSLFVIPNSNWNSKYCNRVVAQIVQMKQTKDLVKAIRNYGRNTQ